MRVVPLRLAAGVDLRGALEGIAAEQGASGFVLGVVGDLTQATFQCPGRPEPSLLRGPLEILSLSGTVGPDAVHLHLSVSDGDGRVWGGHLEPGSLVRKGAEVLLGLLAAPLPAVAAPAGPAVPQAAGPAMADTPFQGFAAPLQATAAPVQGPVAPVQAVAAPVRPASAAIAPEARVEIAVLPGCPFSARAVRLLRTLGIPHRLETVTDEAQWSALERRSGQRSLPQVFLDGVLIGGYDTLADLHGRGELEALRGR